MNRRDENSSVQHSHALLYITYTVTYDLEASDTTLLTLVKKMIAITSTDVGSAGGEAAGQVLCVQTWWCLHKKWPVEEG